MHFGELMEVILYVEKMDRMAAFYHDMMGFAVTYPAGLHDYTDQPWVTFDTGSCTLALHAGGQQRHGADAPKIVFRVGSIKEARRYLIDKQVEIGEIRIAAPGVQVCDGTDPEGNKFSIEQHD